MTRSADSDCVHHWLIAEPSGATSPGTCRKCGERREFYNSVERTAWSALGQSARGTAASAARKGKGVPVDEEEPDSFYRRAPTDVN